MKARQGLRPLAQPDAAHGPPPGSRPRAGQEGQGRLRGQDAGQDAAGRDRAEAAADPRGRQGQEGPHEGADGQGPGGLCRRATMSRPRPSPSRPWRSIPTRSPPRCSPSRPRWSAAQARPGEPRPAKEDGAVSAFQEVDLASVADPEVQINGIKYAKNFKDLTRERLRMNARLEPKKDPKVLAIEAKLKDRSRSTWTSSRWARPSPSCRTTRG